MLSSGTLNLKFMQRNNAPPKKPKLEDSPGPQSSHVSIPSSDVQQPKKRIQETAVTKGKGKHADQLQVNNESKSQTTKIIYEDSLMGFPLLYASSSSSTPVPHSASDVSRNIGRKSYGEFNKTVEKLDQTTTIDSEPEVSVSATSHPSAMHSNRTKPVSQNQQVGSRPTRPDSGPVLESRKRPKPSSSSLSSAARIPNTEQSIRTSADSSGFRKPFNATSIKSKRKKADLSASTTESVNSPTTSQRKKKVRREPETREVVEISGNDSSDDELVSREIENMILEARKAKKT